MSARALLRRVRDNPVVLGGCVAALRACRSLGILRSSRVYSHVPYRGIVTVACGGERSFRICSRGDSMENSLYWDGIAGHEPVSMEAWLDRASRSRTVLDIGANCGLFTLAAAAVGARVVHAFEPLPRVHTILQENLALNDFPEAHAWQLAVGAEEGTATLFDPGGTAPTSATLSAEFASRHFGNLPHREVPVVTIDSFCRAYGVDNIDLIKLDVEGFEECALRGMREVVAQSCPVLLMEVIDDYERPLHKLVDALWPKLYKWQRIDEGNGRVSRNVLLLPQRDGGIA